MHFSAFVVFLWILQWYVVHERPAVTNCLEEGAHYTSGRQSSDEAVVRNTPSSTSNVSKNEYTRGARIAGKHRLESSLNFKLPGLAHVVRPARAPFSPVQQRLRSTPPRHVPPLVFAVRPRHSRRDFQVYSLPDLDSGL